MSTYKKAQMPLSGFDYDVDLGQYLSDGHTIIPSYFHMYYSYRDPYMLFGVVADVTIFPGWVGLGISSDGLMQPSDVVITSWNASTNLEIGDYFVTGKLTNLNPSVCSFMVGSTCIGTLKRL